MGVARRHCTGFIAALLGQPFLSLRSPTRRVTDIGRPPNTSLPYIFKEGECLQSFLDSGLMIPSSITIFPAIQRTPTVVPICRGPRGAAEDEVPLPSREGHECPDLQVADRYAETPFFALGIISPNVDVLLFLFLPYWLHERYLNRYLSSGSLTHILATFRKLLPETYEFDFIDGPHPDGPAAGIDLFYQPPYFKLYEHFTLESVSEGHKWLLAYIKGTHPHSAIITPDQVR